jgi:hypothetical protein
LACQALPACYLERMWTRTIALCLIGCFACSSAPVLPPPLIPEIQRPEKQALPPDPETEALPSETPKEKWVKPLEAGSCLDENGKPRADAPKPCPPKSGILSSEARAAQDGKYRLRYRELRTIKEQDNRIFDVQRNFYEIDAAKMQRQIQLLQPGWLDRNGLALGVVGGFVIGISLSTLFLILKR